MELYHEEYGSGSPVVFIHGFGASIYSWRHLKALSKDYRVILVDLKGFGRSPKPFDSKYSAFDQAELVCGFIKKLGLKEVTLAGHSFGGGVALIASIYLTEREPGLLKRLILIGSVGFPQRLPLFIKALRVPFIGPLAMAVIPDRVMASVVLKQAYYDDGKIPPDAVTEYARPLQEKGADNAIIATARQILPEDLDGLTSRYGSIKVPTLLIWGKEDIIVPLRIGELLHSGIPESRLVVLDKCGHIPQEEEPSRTLSVIEEFLKSNG